MTDAYSSVVTPSSLQHGQCRTEHQRLPIFPVHGQDRVAGRQARCVTHVVYACLCCHTRFPVVFGSVTNGMDVVKKVEALGSQSGATSKRVVIADCGQLS